MDREVFMGEANLAVTRERRDAGTGRSLRAGRKLVAGGLAGRGGGAGVVGP